MDPEENTEYLKLRAFLLTSEDVRMDLVNRRDALRNACNEISGIISPVYVSQVKGTGKQLLHFELFCSLASSNVSDWKKVFEKNSFLCVYITIGWRILQAHIEGRIPWYGGRQKSKSFRIQSAIKKCHFG